MAHSERPVPDGGPRCPACTNTSWTRVGSKPGVNLVKCRACGLVYAHPQPSSVVREKYTAAYDLAAHFAPWTDRKRVLYERRLARLPRPVPGGDRLCDVGCGDGQFLELAATAGWKPFGVELNPPAARAARKRRAVVFEGALEELADLPWSSFDLVTSWDSLEHTPEPREFAGRLARLARPGATVGLTTLNQKSLVRLVFRLQWSMVVEDHFTYWDARSLGQLLTSCGLVTSSIESYGLGRDFVGILDRWRGINPPRDQDVRGQASAEGRWDVRPGVLRMEEAFNAAFRTFGGGVNLFALARRVS